MPAYSYACNNCDATFNVRLTYAELDAAHPACPVCQSENCERLLSRVSVASSSGTDFQAVRQPLESTGGGGCCGGSCGCAH